ncbi:acyltransferase [Trichococcus alkaliphilus]|uniref:acyltransferase n=1 Tax=Trichococcus alkaliphilus TaxID=2052943 RepID=UPI000D0AC94A|nr:acyltransferase [Trichococcus alkaliphilus]
MASKKINKFMFTVQKKIITKVIYFNNEMYMRLFTNYLRRIGISINGKPKFINNDVYFDGNDYSKIILGDNITISREVMFLTHDYSITTAVEGTQMSGSHLKEELYFSKAITIGNNSFIGARASILPGTNIGNNVIIGAGSVVKGIIPDNSIVVGNPHQVIGKTDEWALSKMEENDFFSEK